MRGLAVILLTATASAEPPTFAVRGGIESAGLDWKGWYAHPPPSTTAPALELEAGVWASDHVTVTGVVGSYTRFHFNEPFQPGSAWSVLDGRIGARMTAHLSDPSLPLLLGIGAGVTLQTARGEEHRERDLAKYSELILGASLGHAGPIGFQIIGSIAAGGMDTRELTLGVAWDPPHDKLADPMRRDGVIAAVHVGEAYTQLDDDYLMPRGWGPWLEAEAGARVSPHAAVLAFATYTHISGTSVLQDIGTKTYTEHYGLSDTRLGVRLRGWLVPRVYIAGGVGLVSESLNGAQPSSPFFELEAGIEALRLGAIALELTDFYDVGFDRGCTGFAVGVAYR